MTDTASAAGLERDNALWRFVLAFYARDGVSAACIALQDELGVDVDILLLAIFAQVERGIALGADDLAAVDALVHAWRTEILQPLRRVRIALKSGPPPAPSPATEALRNRIKAAELEAEQIEIALLADWLGRQPARTSLAAGDNAASAVARYFASAAGKSMSAPANAALEALSRVIREAGAGNPR